LIQFQFPGYYEITLKATDSAGNSDSITYDFYIQVDGSNNINILKDASNQDVVGRSYTNIYSGKILGVSPLNLKKWLKTEGKEQYLFDVQVNPTNFVTEYEYEYEYEYDESKFETLTNLTLAQVVELVNDALVGTEITVTRKDGPGYIELSKYNIDNQYSRNNYNT
jgi:hypothetical protein